MAQTMKNLPTMRETWVRSLGQEDPLEKKMAIHSSILAGEVSGQRSLAGYSPWSRKESDRTERLTPHQQVCCCLSIATCGGAVSAPCSRLFRPNRPFNTGECGSSALSAQCIPEAREGFCSGALIISGNLRPGLRGQEESKLQETDRGAHPR